VTSHVETQFGLSAALLKWEDSPSPLSPIPYFVLEGPRALKIVPGHVWYDAREVAGALAQEKRLVANCYEYIHREQAPNESPYLHLGWIYEVQAWVGQKLGEERIQGFKQLGGGGDTCLLRFDTENESFWYKALGSSDPREFTNTVALSRWLPAYLPRICAFDPERHAWLSCSGGDLSLREHGDTAAWAVVIKTLAAMQRESVCYGSHFLEAGFRDLRSSELLRTTEDLFSLMRTLMARQEKNPPAPMTNVQLFDTATALRAAIVELHKLGLPDTVGHSDFNPGNILLSENRCVFIDWSAAHVGNPLLTMEYLLAHFRKHHPDLSAVSDRLRELYLQGWLGAVPEDRMRQALRLSPIVAIFASAIASGAWQAPQRLQRPGMAGYLRSLARMMYREAQLLEGVAAHA